MSQLEENAPYRMRVSISERQTADILKDCPSKYRSLVVEASLSSFLDSREGVATVRSIFLKAGKSIDAHSILIDRPGKHTKVEIDATRKEKAPKITSNKLEILKPNDIDTGDFD